MIRAFLLFSICAQAWAAADRVVIIKVDGLPERLIERYAAEPADGAREGHSKLPWIEHVFGQNGTWLENFYVRGLSLSAPSWSLLDTGRHLEIRGNAEFDRYTLRGYDYLNFFPFYLGYARNKQADMPGVELLDQYNIPLLIDRFPYDQRFQGFQLLQRAVRWKTLEDSLKTKFHRPVKDLFDEWQTGFSIAGSVNEETERELLTKLQDPRIRYLDYFTGDFDHTAHLTNDRVTQFHVIEQLDALIGRVWAAIAVSPLAKSTVLVMVSDHGMNTADGIYSQGYNLIDWLTSAAGGGHHVLMNRHPMGEFKLRGLDPLVSEVITPSSESSYLAGESAHYPTAVVDLDGNERASISLRNNALNIVQILLDQLMHKKLEGRVRAAVLTSMFQVLDGVRDAWTRNVDGLDSELKTLREQIEKQQRMVDALPKKWSSEERAAGKHVEAVREVEKLETWKTEERGYSNYVAVMRRLLNLRASDFDPGKFNTADLIPRRSLGDRNSILELRHYVVGLSAEGLVVGSGGGLDMERSFRHIDYVAALEALRVRNNVQAGVSDHPVDFIAAEENRAVHVWRAGREAVIERRADGELRYAPDVFGIFPDPGWHTEREIFQATYRSPYTGVLVGLMEEMTSEPAPDSYLERKRQLRRADLIAFANNHWNFNVRGFNPGGNHGSFFGVSTHSVLMFAGGEETGVPKGLRVAAPYDSLSLVPTILSLMGRAEADLPGAVIEEVVRPVVSEAKR